METDDPDQFMRNLEDLTALGGGDEPEMCLSALQVRQIWDQTNTIKSNLLLIKLKGIPHICEPLSGVLGWATLLFNGKLVSILSSKSS